MSTRISILYDDQTGTHIFLEGTSEELCFDFEPGCYKNEKYENPALSRERATELCKEVLNYYGYKVEKK